MNISIIIACLSSLCLALMIIFDRLLIGDCYRNQPKQAWVVSSVCGMVMGIFSTVLIWVFMSVANTDYTLSIFFISTIDLLFPYGLFVLLAGMMAMQVLYHYFHTFIPEKGRSVNETAVAMWLASSPIWIFIVIAILQYSEIEMGFLSGIEKAVVTWEFGFLLLLSVSTLVQFEKVSQGNKFTFVNFFYSRYIRSVVLIQVYTVGYVLILSGVLRDFADDFVATMSLLPWYFLGFGTGMVWLFFSRSERDKLYRNKRRLLCFLVPILLAEVIGMLVFFFEFFALSAVDPTLVNLIIGFHVILVFFLMLGLRFLRLHMHRNKIRRYWFCGFRIKSSRLPTSHDRCFFLREFFWFLVAVVMLGACIVYVA